MRYRKEFYPHHSDAHIGNLKRFYIASVIVIVIGLSAVAYLTIKDEPQINIGETEIKNNLK